MYAKNTVTVADTTITNYTVSADELHIFIADNWNMKFTDDNTGLVYVSNDDDEEEDYTYSDEDEPSWTELTQDNYPSDENGKIFDTPSGF